MPEINTGVAFGDEVEIDPPLYECSHCGADYDSEESADYCCAYQCPRCGDRYSEEYSAETCCPVYECPDCGAEWEDEDDAQSCCHSRGRSYPALSDLQEVHLLSIPALPNRPARLCSIEQEITRGGAEAAQMLYDFGFADQSGITGYSSSPNRGRVGVTTDASLPSVGGEVIYSRFLLSEQHDVEQMSMAVAKMRQLAREANVVRVGKAAGTHIHVSATAEDGTRLGPSQMAALHEIFCYAEDF